MRARKQFQRAEFYFKTHEYHLAYNHFDEERKIHEERTETRDALICESHMLKCQHKLGAVPLATLLEHINSWLTRMMNSGINISQREAWNAITELRAIVKLTEKGQVDVRANYLLMFARRASQINAPIFSDFARVMEIDETNFQMKVDHIRTATIELGIAKWHLPEEKHDEVTSLIATMHEDIGDIYIDAFFALEGAPLSVKKDLFEQARKAYGDAIGHRVRFDLQPSALLLLAHLNTLQELFAIAREQQDAPAKTSLHIKIHRILSQEQIERVIPMEEEAVREEATKEMGKYYFWYVDIMKGVTQSDAEFIRFLRRSASAKPSRYAFLWQDLVDDLLRDQPVKKRHRGESLMMILHPGKRARLETYGLFPALKPTESSTSSNEHFPEEAPTLVPHDFT